MALGRIPVLVARPIAGSTQRRARRNAAQATAEVLRRRSEREDVEAFFRQVLPKQRRSSENE